MQIKPEFFPAFIDATQKAFKDMAGIDAHLQSEKEQMGLPEGQVDIAGVIGITAKEYKGSLTIGFSQDAFLSFISGMLGEEYTEISNDLEDGAAEVSNIVFGHAKVTLNQLGHEIQMALPTVVRGNKMGSSGSSEGHRHLVTLATGRGNLYLFFQLKENNKQDNQAAQKQKESNQSKAPVPQLDSQVLMSFVNGVRKTFEVQVGVEINALTPFLKNDKTSFQFSIASLIGVTALGFKGSFAICFDQEAFLGTIEKMLGEKYTEIPPEIEDGAGEIVNIVFGVAKQALNEQGHAIRMALPSIIRGSPLRSSYFTEKPPIVVPFKLPYGKIWVEFAFQKEKEK